VSLARFYSRINDAIGPLLRSPTDLAEYLSQKVVSLEAPDDLENYPLHLSGFVLAANLCARLYPRLQILGPKRVTDECASLALQINPSCEIETKPGTSNAILAWCTRPSSNSAVFVSPANWNILIDFPDAERIQSTNILTSLAAAAFGVGEVFRAVFAEFLPSGGVRPLPGNLNLLTLNDSRVHLPDLPSDIDIGHVHLAGAGAVGQAFVYALARVSATGRLVVLDPERISLSNLQRYILALDSDVEDSKCSLVSRALKDSRIETICQEVAWGYDLETTENVETVCTAVDTESVRIAIQAGLPRRIYNAWTQPADIGWSRHEYFSKEPCLACLYWPTRGRPNQHELIAQSVRQHELRVLAYLTHSLPVDVPLRPEQIPRLVHLPVPADSSSWVDCSILEDIARSLDLDLDGLSAWKGKQLSDLYREGICGGAIIRGRVDGIPQDVAVPLAHQSALAGIMLAAQLLISSSPQLIAFRPASIEARIDLLTGLHQVAPRPRQKTPNCICSDSDFVTRYFEKWPRK